MRFVKSVMEEELNLMNKLLNCPFCGAHYEDLQFGVRYGEAKLHSEDTPIKKGEGHYNYDFVAVFQIHCVKCNFVCSNFFETEHEAIKAWNTRATVEPPLVSEDELRLLIYEGEEDKWRISFGSEELAKAILAKFPSVDTRKLDEGKLKELKKIVCKDKKHGGKFFYPVGNVHKNSYLVGWINGTFEMSKAICQSFKEGKLFGKGGE